MGILSSATTTNLKLFLVIVAIFIAGGTIYFTQVLVQELQARERESVELYAKSLKYVASPESDNVDFTFIFENLIKRIDFPLILTDDKDRVIFRSGIGVRNLEIDSTLSSEEIDQFLSDTITKLGKEHKPIPINYPSSIFSGKIYYGDSDIILRLQYYPYMQISLAVIFVLIAYLSFSHVKKTEESNIWVGMAKETAHQLGTPISSLMGWAEMLKINYEKPDTVLDTAHEMNSDLIRLNKIALRFSKIGSRPELKEENLFTVINRVIKYFNKRLPHTGKNVELTLHGNSESRAMVNIELFEWVIENLIKNALDAIGDKKGIIDINISEAKNEINIEVVDNGKGIDPKKRKEVFKPGYSTKRRGWGLGLSLSRRIVENYHSGKIFVKHTVINEGTTFRIALKKFQKV
ncbi:MAG: HAMP domain-containing histidine kinase [Bacteroidetes bacterium]|nr:HAMP domain-containing histidine kinase [Bacteroidota bacterium]